MKSDRLAGRVDPGRQSVSPIKTTAQFEICQPCEKTLEHNPEHRRYWAKKKLPFAVWVLLPKASEELLKISDIPCGAREIYLVAADETAVVADFGDSRGAVCEHMGHLIE